MINVNIGHIVKLHRKQQKLEQADLAKKIEVSQPVLSRLENGAANWTVRRLLLTCNVLNIDINSLITQALSIYK